MGVVSSKDRRLPHPWKRKVSGEKFSWSQSATSPVDATKSWTLDLCKENFKNPVKLCKLSNFPIKTKSILSQLEDSLVTGWQANKIQFVNKVLELGCIQTKSGDPAKHCRFVRRWECHSVNITGPIVVLCPLFLLQSKGGGRSQEDNPFTWLAAAVT